MLLTIIVGCLWGYSGILCCVQLLCYIMLAIPELTCFSYKKLKPNKKVFGKNPTGAPTMPKTQT